LKKAYAKLKKIEKRSGQSFDWNKVKKIVSGVRGIPLPVSEIRHCATTGVMETIRVRHPDKLYGKPEVPELETDAWYVMAAVTPNKVEAQRLAAMINHQGPQIPARVLSAIGGHRVLAGPFNNIRAAKDAVKRLKIDLEIDGILVEPVEKKSPDT
jgi:L,D-transpeptidase ErfK/SrfK